METFSGKYIGFLIADFSFEMQTISSHYYDFLNRIYALITSIQSNLKHIISPAGSFQGTFNRSVVQQVFFQTQDISSMSHCFNKKLEL